MLPNPQKTQIVVALIQSAVATALLFVFAGMADRACHCMNSMFSLFPYGTFVMMHYSFELLGLPLVLIQFPLYAVVITLVKGWRWRVRVLLALIALHVATASFALRLVTMDNPEAIVWNYQMSELIQIVWRFLQLFSLLALPQLLGVLVYFRIRRYQSIVAHLVGFVLPPLLFFYLAILFWLYVPAKARPHETCGMYAAFASAMVWFGTLISVLASLAVQLMLRLRRSS